MNEEEVLSKLVEASRVRGALGAYNKCWNCKDLITDDYVIPHRYVGEERFSLTGFWCLPCWTLIMPYTWVLVGTT